MDISKLEKCLRDRENAEISETNYRDPSKHTNRIQRAGQYISIIMPFQTYILVECFCNNNEQSGI